MWHLSYSQTISTDLRWVFSWWHPSESTTTARSGEPGKSQLHRFGGRAQCQWGRWAGFDWCPSSSEGIFYQKMPCRWKEGSGQLEEKRWAGKRMGHCTWASPWWPWWSVTALNMLSFDTRWKHRWKCHIASGYIDVMYVWGRCLQSLSSTPALAAVSVCEFKGWNSLANLELWSEGLNVPGKATCDAEKKEFGHLWEPTEPHVHIAIVYTVVFQLIGPQNHSNRVSSTPARNDQQELQSFKDFKVLHESQLPIQLYCRGMVPLWMMMLPQKRATGGSSSQLSGFDGAIHMEKGNVFSSGVYCLLHIKFLVAINPNSLSFWFAKLFA
mgnify:FL=1